MRKLAAANNNGGSCKRGLSIIGEGGIEKLGLN